MRGDDQFDLSKLRELQRDADELAQTLAAAATAASADFIGADATGTVEVTTDATGAPAGLWLARNWQQTVGTSGLSAAVVAALTAANTDRLTAWANGASHGDQPQPVTGPSPVARQAEVGDPSSRQSVHALRDLVTLIDGVASGLTDMAEAAEAAVTRSVTSTNPAHTVRVTATGGMVTAIEFDERWLRTAHHERVAGAILEALTASIRDATEARQRALDSVPGLDRVQRLTASPDALFREIGFIR